MSIPSEESRDEPRTSEEIDYMTDTRPIAAGETAPRLQEARSDRGGGKRHPQLRRHQRRRRRVPRDPAAQDHRTDRPQRRRQDHPVQPAHGLRHPELGYMAVRGQQPRRRLLVQGGPDGHGAHVPAHQGHGQAHRAWRTCAWAPPTSPANGSPRPCSRASGAARKREITARSQRAAGEVQAGRQEGRLRGVAVRRPAQAAGNGPLPHGPAQAGHARRADGRRQPGADAVAAGPHQEPQGRGHDRLVRRARHAHGPPHRRLGGGDGRGQDRGRRPARRSHEEPRRDRRLPRRPPRRRPRRRRGHQGTGRRAGRRRGIDRRHRKRRHHLRRRPHHRGGRSRGERDDARPPQRRTSRQRAEEPNRTAKDTE